MKNYKFVFINGLHRTARYMAERNINSAIERGINAKLKDECVKIYTEYKGHYTLAADINKDETYNIY